MTKIANGYGMIDIRDLPDGENSRMEKTGQHGDIQPAVGWRNKKKAKTRAAIQREALRLFKEQGYNETTIEQIAEASEISRITFFRYFATKADVVLCDIDFIDNTVMEATLSEPSEMSPIQALRKALSKLYLESPDEELEMLKERHLLLRTVPELRTATLSHYAGKIRLIGEMVAKRTGRSPDDFAVCNFACVISGIWTAVWISTQEDISEGFIDRFYELLDAGLKHLAEGLPL
jgi:AcrR family transcriptional regulator